MAKLNEADSNNDVTLTNSNNSGLPSKYLTRRQQAILSLENHLNVPKAARLRRVLLYKDEMDLDLSWNAFGPRKRARRGPFRFTPLRNRVKSLVPFHKQTLEFPQIPHHETFARRLYGDEGKMREMTNMTISPWSGNLLKKYIHRDYDTKPDGMLTLEKLSNVKGYPLDYVYLQNAHLTQVNQMLQREFWPYINVVDNLQYPEFSIVAMYKRLVVGCALMTPDGYITYVAVLPGWTKSGIARFMIHYLIEKAGNRDITLHVSANNPAMILYQSLGFKPEEFLVNFYDKYLPEDSTACRNAFFIRRRSIREAGL